MFNPERLRFLLEEGRSNQYQEFSKLVSWENEVICIFSEMQMVHSDEILTYIINQGTK